MDYPVIIVGAGPAGIFAALTLADLGIDRVLLLEQGKDLDAGSASAPRTCSAAGAGRVPIATASSPSPPRWAATWPSTWTRLPHGLLQTADQIYVRFGAPDRPLRRAFAKAVEELADRARLADLELVPTQIRHIGTENCREVLTRVREASQVEWRRAPGAGWRVSSPRGGASRESRLPTAPFVAATMSLPRLVGSAPAG